MGLDGYRAIVPAIQRALAPTIQRFHSLDLTAIERRLDAIE